jgi:hypothetical protein
VLGLSISQLFSVLRLEDDRESDRINDEGNNDSQEWQEETTPGDVNNGCRGRKRAAVEKAGAIRGQSVNTQWRETYIAKLF